MALEEQIKNEIDQWYQSVRTGMVVYDTNLSALVSNIMYLYRQAITQAVDSIDPWETTSGNGEIDTVKLVKHTLMQKFKEEGLTR